jgi:hypothetical protein
MVTASGVTGRASHDGVVEAGGGVGCMAAGNGLVSGTGCCDGGRIDGEGGG